MPMDPAFPAWLAWLERSAPAVAMIVHLLGIVLLAGSAFMFDLRLLGLSRHVRVSDMAKHLAGAPHALGASA